MVLNFRKSNPYFKKKYSGGKKTTKCSVLSHKSRIILKTKVDIKKKEIFHSGPKHNTFYF